MTKISLVILAAGQSMRFGAPKQIAEFKGKPLLQRAIDTCLSVGKCETYVVLGANASAIMQKINFTDVTILENPHWQEGIASSIRFAVNSLKLQSDAIVFIASDQALLTTASIENLVLTAKKNETGITCASYANLVGIPAAFPRPFYDDLMKLKGDVGAKGLFRKFAAKVTTIEMDEARHDIDTQEQLKRLQD